jgi:hypothetical protein
MLCDQASLLNLPPSIAEQKTNVKFHSVTDRIYLPIVFKETETLSALKAVEACIASGLADVRYGRDDRNITISLERATCFGFQAYLATVGGCGKLDKGLKAKLKKGR